MFFFRGVNMRGSQYLGGNHGNSIPKIQAMIFGGNKYERYPVLIEKTDLPWLFMLYPFYFSENHPKPILEISQEAMSLMSACWKNTTNTTTQPTPTHQPCHPSPDLQLATEGPQHRWQFESSIAGAQKPLAKRLGLRLGTAVATHGAQFQGKALRFAETEMVFLLGDRKMARVWGGWFRWNFGTLKKPEKKMTWNEAWGFPGISLGWIQQSPTWENITVDGSDGAEIRRPTTLWMYQTL